jgi:5'-deoxynucleotidase YfbR-like HD superfamily hydrolase
VQNLSDPESVVGVMKRTLQFVLEGGGVVRFHTRPSLRPNSDAHHSHGVAMLCHILSGGNDPTGKPRASATLLIAALSHDLGEQVASDISAPSKRILGLVDKLGTFEQGQLAAFGLAYEHLLTEEERSILKWADMFDGMLHCCQEVALGNKMMMLPFKRWTGYADLLKPTFSPYALTVCLAIQELYEEYINEPKFDCFSK